MHYESDFLFGLGVKMAASIIVGTVPRVQCDRVYAILGRHEWASTMKVRAAAALPHRMNQ